MTNEIKTKKNEVYLFRELNADDGFQLGVFFESLSSATRSKFGPHPLTGEQAGFLCLKIGMDNTVKFVVLDKEKIIGYFILDFNPFEHEAERYSRYDIILEPARDPVFAPCIADAFQNSGIAGKAMEQILIYAKERKLRSLVLMGGTQEPNELARAFYKKYGFIEYANFYTDYNGLNNIDMMLLL